MAEKKMIQVWSEGYAATGESSDAMFHGEFEAVDFADAVHQWLSTLKPESEKKYYSYRDGKHMFWACQLFDNEADARKSFG